MKKWLILFLLLLPLSFFVVTALLQTPSNDRNWTVDQKVLPEIRIGEEEIIIKNVRNFTYESTSSYTPHYYDTTKKRGSVSSVWFVSEPFKDPGAAHTFLSFGFEDGTFLSISVEIRKEVGESFSPIKGMLNRYELTYVIADERDVILLRANHRKDPVYLYRANISKEKANELFISMLRRAKELQEKPEFYNTLTNTCTTNIVDHINTLAPNKIPFDKRILFPKNADYYAYELGLLDTDLPKEKIREHYKINTISEQYSNDPNYSKKIRSVFGTN